MEATKLMIDDLVYLDESNKNVKVAEILTHCGNYYISIKHNNNMIEEFEDSFITPIPLTKEILEKNTKVEPIESSPVDYTDYVFDEDTSVVYEKGEPFMFYHESSKHDHIYKKVEYVHELQHLLRLVGYEKEIKL